MRASDRLEEIQARADHATDGPWSRHDYGSYGDQEPSSIIVHRGKFDWEAIGEGEYIAAMPNWDRQEDNDAEFIAHARTDVPHLVAAVQAFFDATREHRDRDRLGCECPACEGYHAACAALEL